MKKLLVLVVLLAIAFYLYQQGNLTGLNFQAAAPSLAPILPTATHDFNAVSNLLRQDLENLPANLDDAPRPLHAHDVKRILRTHLNDRAEYQTLNQVCDLIIQADTERNTLQQSSRAEQRRTAFHSALDPVDKRAPAAASDSGNRAAIRQRMDSTWSGYRENIAGEVDRLLDTLKGRTL